jgi:hypothetical protein
VRTRRARYLTADNPLTVLSPGRGLGSSGEALFGSHAGRYLNRLPPVKNMAMARIPFALRAPILIFLFVAYYVNDLIFAFPFSINQHHYTQTLLNGHDIEPG